MRSITLGRTDLEVSRIAFGTWQLGGEWGRFDEAAAIDAIRGARDLGITLFDTAQAYGFGASEQLLGRALRPELTGDRDSVVIATKGGHPARPSATPRGPSCAGGWRRACATSASTSSTSTRSTGPTPSVPAEETAGALQEMVDEGKIRFAGVSNYDVAATWRPSRRSGRSTTLQPPYHLFRRGDRGRDPPLRARPRHRRARLQPPGQRAAGRADRRGHHLRARRLARPGERLHRRGPAAQPGGGAAARGPGRRPRHQPEPARDRVGARPARGARRHRGRAQPREHRLERRRRPTSSSRRRPSPRIDEIAADAEQIEGATPEGVL